MRIISDKIPRNSGKIPISNGMRNMSKLSWFFYKNKRRFHSANIVRELTKISVKNCESDMFSKKKTIVTLYTICNF